MTIHETSDGDVLVLAPDGDLDGARECAMLDQILNVRLEQGARFVVLDFGQVGQVGGPALRAVLLATRKLGHRNGRLVLCRLGESVHRVFAISKLDHDFLVADSLEEGIRRAAEPGAPAPAGPPVQESPADHLTALADLAWAAVGSGAPGGAGAANLHAPATPIEGFDPDVLAAVVLQALSV